MYIYIKVHIYMYLHIVICGESIEPGACEASQKKLILKQQMSKSITHNFTTQNTNIYIYIYEEQSIRSVHALNC